MADEAKKPTEQTEAQAQPEATQEPKASPSEATEPKETSQTEDKPKATEPKETSRTEDKAEAGATGKAPKGAEQGAVHKARIKPELGDEDRGALGLRRAKKAQTPAFRRQEWWRYRDLGGKHAPWRRPRGMHSKMRRHYKFRPPVVSVGYRGPASVRGRHPSGFEEVLVHRPGDLDELDPKTQAARVGRTVGGRKAEAIETHAAKLGIRILNPRGAS